MINKILANKPLLATVVVGVASLAAYLLGLTEVALSLLEQFQMGVNTQLGGAQ